MFSESYRPRVLNDVIGHDNAKKELKEYLNSSFKGCVFLVGSPGIGKTTLTLCAAKTFGFDPIEINASKMLRSFNDVTHLRDSCRGAINMQSFLVGDPTRKSCIILDELDGSDPHAQTKIIEWIREKERRVPILCTGNDIPSIFSKHPELIKIIRCTPPASFELSKLFPNQEFKNSETDIRKIMNTVQYGESYSIPKYILPPTGSSPEITFLIKQTMFGIPDPLECLSDKLGSGCLHQTMYECKMNDKHVRTPLKKNHCSKQLPDKLHTKPEIQFADKGQFHVPYLLESEEQE